MIVRTVSVFTLVCMLVLGMATTAGADGHIATLDATLLGSNEVGGGDPDGTGSALVVVEAGAGEVCFDIQVNNVAAVTAAHIHVGGAGTNGGVVVDLDWPTTNGVGCVSAGTAVLASIENIPSGYYVNVHNEEYPGGAVRGQLAVADAAAAPPQLAFTGTNLTAVLAIAGAAMVAAGTMMVRLAPRRRLG